MRKFGFALLSALTLWVGAAQAQRKTLDEVAAVVGSSIILKSDIDFKYAQYVLQGGRPDPGIKCQIMQQLLTQKLLAQQAVIDSVSVSDDDVDNNIDRRMRYMMSNAGGQDRLEQFLGRSIIQYKDEIRPDMKEQAVAQKMQQKITEKVSVTPMEVNQFFRKIPKDSLPSYNKEVEVGEIVFQPKLSKEEKAVYKAKAEDLLRRVKAGEDFGTLARLYSQDPGSASNGGDLGFFDRSTMVKEFTANAFRMKVGEISPVFETENGFHFLQVLERRGEQVHARHILIMPVMTQAAIDRTKVKADSVYDLLTKNKQVDFSNAAAYYSDDKGTKYNGGMMLNERNVENRSTYIPTDQLDPQMALTLDTMKVGELSKPQLYTDQRNTKTYKILLLRSATTAHKASLTEDFPKLKELAQSDKINRVTSEWFEKRRKETFIRIDPEYLACSTLKDWNTPAGSLVTAQTETPKEVAANTPAAAAEKPAKSKSAKQK